MRTDTSERTKIVRRYNRAFFIALICVIIGLIGTFGGFRQYDRLVEKSSSPIGTKMHFERSNADVSISGLYTDEAESVLVVRFSSDEQSSLRLPYKGSDYRVFLATDPYNSYAGQNVSVLFGRYMTNGDMFLIIPKPLQDVYTIFLMNANFIATDIMSEDFSGDAAVSSLGNLSEEELEYTLMQSLNQYEYQDIRERSNSITVKSDALDIVGFRATLDPALDTDDYRVRVIPGQLLSDAGEFDFESFFNSVFKDTVTENIDDDYRRTQNQAKLLSERIEELEARLEANPNDTAVKQYLDTVRSDLATVQNQLDQLADTYNKYATVTYSSNMFRDMQTEATVLSTAQAAQLG